MEEISEIHTHYDCDCGPVNCDVSFYKDRVGVGVRYKCPTCDSKVLTVHCYGYNFDCAEKCQHPGCDCEGCEMSIEIDYFSDMLRKPKPESNLVRFLKKKKELARNRK